MQPDFAAANRRVMEGLTKKYGVTPGTMDYVTLGPVCAEPRRVVKVPRPPIPAAGAEGHPRAEPSPLEAALLDTVHRHHLQALAMMGRELVGRHARGMLLAGYAYGLHDPVCNILVNCLWHDAVFPASSSREVLRPMMLSCKAVFRLARRSLDALVAFMCGCFACEFMGMKLIHPVDEKFNGQYDFTKGRDLHMAELFRKDPTSEFDVPLIDDYIFFELDQHPEVITFLETTYSYMSDDQVDLSLLWFENYLP